MHALRFPSALILLALAGCTSPPPSTLTPAQRDSLNAEVQAFVAELTEAMNAHDPERVLSLYRDSDEFVYMGCTDPLFGYQSFATRVAPYYRNRTDVTFQQQILGIQILGPTTAVVTLRGSSTEAEDLFWTEVLVKEEGRWLIAHEHESWPDCPEASGAHPGSEGMPAPTDSAGGS